MISEIGNKIKEIEEKIITHRRHIHYNPELSFQEYSTSEYISNVLNELGIESEKVAETGVSALIGKGDRCVALRADIDALPIWEQTGLPFSSKNEGVMHACGHDMHTAMLLGAAEALKSIEKELNGTVKLIFQPGEEKLPGGAVRMIDQGILEDPEPEAVFAQHVNTGAPTGTILASPGAVMASSDELDWIITGKGSHAGQPHLGRDPVISAAQLIVYLQSIITKFRNPLNPVLLSITSVHGGSAHNIIPEKVEIKGTLRAYDEDLRIQLLEVIKENSCTICDLYGTECEFRANMGYPSLINNEITTELVRKTGVGLFGPNAVESFEPKMWAEDFAYFTRKIMSTYWTLGVRPLDKEEISSLHTPQFNPDEKALSYGAAMLAAVAYNFLQENEG